MVSMILRALCFSIFFAILCVQQQCVCVVLLENSPSPAPVAGGDLGSKTPSSAPSPSPSPLVDNVNSPPAPTPVDHSPNAAPASSPAEGAPAPVPAPSDVAASDISHEKTTTTAEVDEDDGGMDGGKKAGVAFGVIAAMCVVGLGALVYKKRRQNIRRAQFGYAARRDFL
ncbi:vegetative cell wall protein gp1 isoform X2 [Capsicum annuum]|uniref:vegetative cell wall protein gp1 isoform X2 n=1 Tax=Capsicum annuum TaxID=4072 RepID=UPI0007BF57BC|nr:vegetative cell wall protein gp1 isoform X2 [Capsicum annuum]